MRRSLGRSTTSMPSVLFTFATSPDGDVLNDVHLTGEQGGGTGCGVADRAHGDFFDLRCASPVVLVGLHGDVVFLDPFLEDVRAGTHGSTVERRLSKLRPVLLRKKYGERPNDSRRIAVGALVTIFTVWGSATCTSLMEEVKFFSREVRQTSMV